ncbi:TetR/AcrR family transcriptional regulator [Streptomyces sp. NPDC059568]|uniref:TetR/AcrR family transcriptional regulator n=1 Tax=Streptomyces sp. NPDC059568 TaxID=3346868 RepID=UPI0036843753
MRVGDVVERLDDKGVGQVPLHRTSTRDIARAAVRAELAQVAFDLFRREGFDRVTVNDVAAAAGVSRSAPSCATSTARRKPSSAPSTRRVNSWPPPCAPGPRAKMTGRRCAAPWTPSSSTTARTRSAHSRCPA